MPYEPLHHKYRPQTFAQLVGQEAIAATLSNALRQQRIAPAYLFTGPRGTGKTSSARILAKSLNCTRSPIPTDTPCGTCDICRMIARGSALDVIEIDAASNTGVDNIRELIERAQFAPVQCRFKVYIIDEVHMLSTAAFNALLKTLEEPPNQVVFVLATTDPQRVLPTIISRCQRFDYRRIPLEAMVSHLMAIAQQESIAAQPEAVELVAQIAQGGLRDAESLLDQLSLLDGEISVEKVWDLVGAVPERDLLALVQAIAQDDSTTVLDQARHLMNRGREPLIVLQNLASFYRDLLIAKTAGDRRDLVSLTQPTWTALCEFAQTVDISTILLGQQHLRASEVQVKNTTQPRLWLEITLLGLLPSTLNSQTTVAGGLELKASVDSSSRPRPAISSAASNGSRSNQPTPLEPPKPAPSAAPTITEPTSPPSQPHRPPQPEIQPQDSPSPAAHANHASALDEADSSQPHPARSKPQPSALQQTASESKSANALAQSQGYAAFQQDKLNQIWQQVMAKIPRPGTQALLKQQGCLLGFDGRSARVGIRSQPLMRMAQSKLSDIEQAFEQVFDEAIAITLEISAAQPETPNPAAAAPVAPPRSTPDIAARYQPPSPESASAPSEAPSPSQLSSAPEPQVGSDTTQSFTSSPVAPESTPAASAAAPRDSEPAFNPAPFSWKDEDEVTKAAKSLAQMFNGEIVNLDDDHDPTDEPINKPANTANHPASAESSTASAAAHPSDDDDDNDVPF